MHIYHFFPSLDTCFRLHSSFFRQHFRPSLWPLSAAVQAPSGQAPRAPPSRRPKPLPARLSSTAVRTSLRPFQRLPALPTPLSRIAQRLPLSRSLSVAARSAPLSLPTPLCRRLSLISAIRAPSPESTSAAPSLERPPISVAPAPTPERRQRRVPNVGSPERPPVRCITQY